MCLITFNFILLFSLVATSWAETLDFPPGFKFGAATSAYQIEGAWNASEKGESIWDRFVHSRSEVYATTGDVACDSYRNWRRDIEMAKELGLDFYRISISWPRILPKGFTNTIDVIGVDYYNNVINGLIAAGIEPIITIYHWDLPQTLQDFGGWLNPMISDWFADYARLVFKLYGDRVKTWFTMNEPNVICDFSYITGGLAPGIMEPEVAPFVCSKNLVMAHAKAWRLYEKEFKHKYRGRISFANQIVWYETLNDSNDLAELSMEFLLRYDHPIYSKAGGWLPEVEDIIAYNSKQKGYPWTRLPKFTKEEIEFVRGTYDFYAVNYYTSRVVWKASPGERVEHYPKNGVPELGAKLGVRTSWDPISTQISAYPGGLRKTLKWLNKKYGDIPILISENGFVSSLSELDDDNRINYMQSHLKEVLKAINEDKINVIGYTYWSLMDNFEWIGQAYNSKFGLYQVDFEDPRRTRTPRKSAFYYKSIIQNRTLDVPTEPAGWEKPARNSYTKNEVNDVYNDYSVPMYTYLYNNVFSQLL